jgi:hypothetical protein
MKTKYVCLFVGLLLMTTMVSTGKPLGSEPMSPVVNDGSPKTTNVDVPVWHVGDWWSYDIGMFTAHIVKANQSYNFSFKPQDLNLTVINDAGTMYMVALTISQIIGDVNVSGTLEGGVITIVASLNDTKANGTILFDKADLGIRQIQIHVSGQLHAKIMQLPGISLRRPIPIRGTSNISLVVTYDAPYTVFSFPFDLGSFWGRPAVNMTLDGTVQSTWLTRINFINNIIQKHWKVVKFITGLFGIDSAALKNISDICADILPTIHIGTVLQTYMGGNTFPVLGIDPMFICTGVENVSVKAGNFSAYNISVLGQGDIYYAPDVRNIIKISGHFTTETFPFLKTLEIQLTDTSYS